MLKDEVEQRFVKLLLKAGVTHQALEAIVNSRSSLSLAARIKPELDQCAEEAIAVARAPMLHSV